MTLRRSEKRIIRLMKKPVTAVLDWLWDRLTYIVMNQGVVTDTGHQTFFPSSPAAGGAGPDRPRRRSDESGQGQEMVKP
jgi:hypothetical protein